jgi:large subunit ribosomal protein L25
LNELEIETEATNVPTEFQIAVNEMTIGDTLTVADIKVDADITVLTDPEEAVVVLSAPVTEEVAEEVAPTEEAEKVTE